MEGGRRQYENRKIGVAVLCVIGAFLLISPFFAKDFVFFDFHMAVQDYSFSYLHEDKPRSAGTAVWFSFREAGKELQIGLDNGISDEDVTIYSLSQSGDAHAVASREDPIQPDSLGHFIATLPPTEREGKTVYESAPADLGPNAFSQVKSRRKSPKNTPIA
jgi:hypothetical protein